MSATKGVVVARIHVLNQLEVNAQLDPAIASILDTMEPGWRADQAAMRWMATADAVSEWAEATGRSPEIIDDGAAGLRPWLDSQDINALPVERRRVLESLRGWRSTLDDPAAGPAWRVVVALVDQGTMPSQGRSRAAVVWLAGEYRRAHPQLTFGEPRLSGAPATALLDFALFCARYGRQPELGDTGHRWLTHPARPAATAASADLYELDALTHVTGPTTAWLVAAHRVRQWLHANKRRPRRTGLTREERYCSGWLKRQRRRAADGTLTDVAREALARMESEL